MILSFLGSLRVDPGTSGAELVVFWLAGLAAGVVAAVVAGLEAGARWLEDVAVLWLGKGVGADSSEAVLAVDTFGSMVLTVLDPNRMCSFDFGRGALGRGVVTGVEVEAGVVVGAGVGGAGRSDLSSSGGGTGRIFGLGRGLLELAGVEALPEDPLEELDPLTTVSFFSPLGSRRNFNPVDETERGDGLASAGVFGAGVEVGAGLCTADAVTGGLGETPF